MNASFLQVLISLIAGIAVIVILTSRYNIHAFFALMIACFVTGLGVGMLPAEIINTTKEGFGSIMRSLGFIIVLGTALGVLLEHTRSTQVMANYILKKTGEKHAALALSLTGFIVGLPVFCDSGYIVLNGLNKSLIKRTGLPAVVMSISLATGLYAVHCLLPPHPGAAAAASSIGADYGRLMLYGIAVAIPAMLTGYWWANKAGKNFVNTAFADTAEPDEAESEQPGVIQAFLPVIVPIVLIAAASFMHAYAANAVIKNILFLGDPVMALTIGILLAFFAKKKWHKNTVGSLLQEAAEKAGGILVIIGAGGAFGAILAATKIGDHFSNAVTLSSIGLLFPFLLTVVLKTAQGSSTVAIITAASIVQPLLAVLGLHTDAGKLIAVLAMGAGSMMISHANDAYFWVISRFSSVDMRAMLKVYSTATILMGIVSFFMTWLLSLLIL